MSDVVINKIDICQVADTLFEEKGFGQVSLGEIAEVAAVPLNLLEAVYSSTQAIALTIYQNSTQFTVDEIAHLPSGTVSQRYFALLESRLAQLAQHQEAMTGLFASAMSPSSPIQAADISPGMRDPLMSALKQLVNEASNAPTKDGDDLVLLLYTFHFLLILFWLYDRTEEKQASHLFTNFLREFFKMARPMMVMPMFSKAMRKMAKIMMLVFGGARLVDE